PDPDQSATPTKTSDRRRPVAEAVARCCLTSLYALVPAILRVRAGASVPMRGCQRVCASAWVIARGSPASFD
ncbi:hypothetical protein, partial [Gemmatimonas sp.]|uniref:hypothetical protein n=1 Tax=Gemmatimonas sp. TaxID=1962908 RepID=UPI00391F26BB